MYLFDTEHLSLLQRDSAESFRIRLRLDQIPSGEIATTIITYEEQMRGWLAVAAKADTAARMIEAYARLSGAYQDIHIDSHFAIRTQGAAGVFDDLRRLRLRVGTMDLKIAAIALANQATLLTRNFSDFKRVPGLQVEDWTQ